MSTDYSRPQNVTDPVCTGFLQALTGLDVADNKRDATSQIMHSLLQGLLGSPTFDTYEGKGQSYPFGMILYYFWSTLTIIILLNILIALFNSAYENVSDDAIAHYMAFFAQSGCLGNLRRAVLTTLLAETISSVRAPDQFVYVAPFNLVELPLLRESGDDRTETTLKLARIALEYILSRKTYSTINNIIMKILFFPAL